jgi:tetratricopeptide (TPR) repeat protein
MGRRWSLRVALLIVSQLLAMSAPTKASAEPPDDLAVLSRRVVQLIDAAKYAEAIPVAQRALATAERRFGPDNLEVGTALNNLAELYRATGQYAKAEPLYRRDLAIAEKRLGPDHPDVANSLNNLALLYSDQGRHADATPLAKRALAIREKIARARPPVCGEFAQHAARAL